MSDNWSGNGNPNWIEISKEELICEIKNGLSLEQLGVKFLASNQTIISKIKTLLGFDGLLSARNFYMELKLIRKPSKRLSLIEAEEIKILIKNKMKQKDIAKKYNVSNSTINNIARGNSHNK